MKGKEAAEFRTCIILYLLQLLGNTHACVNSLSALGVLCLIVFQEVASGELCGNEACQRRIWNSIRAPVLLQGLCLQQLQPQLPTQWERQTFWVSHCKVEEKETSLGGENCFNNILNSQFESMTPFLYKGWTCKMKLYLWDTVVFKESKVIVTVCCNSGINLKMIEFCCLAMAKYNETMAATNDY